MTQIDNSPVFADGSKTSMEAYFVMWTDVANKRAMMVRYVLAGPYDIAEAWCYYLDKNPGGRDIALRKRFPLSAAEIGGDAHYRMGENGLSDEGAWGDIVTDDCHIQWDFRFESGDEIGVDRLADVRDDEFMPKFYSPRCRHRLSGSVSVDGERMEVSNVWGSDGHYWGLDHMQQWSWANWPNAASEKPFLAEALSAKMAPWASNNVWTAFDWNGESHRTGLVQSMYVNEELESELERWKTRSRFGDRVVDLTLEAHAEDMVMIIHPLGDGNFLYTTMTMFADVKVEVFEDRDGELVLLDTLKGEQCANFEVTKPVRNERVSREFKIVEAS